jgi:hypothetical protein
MHYLYIPDSGTFVSGTSYLHSIERVQLLEQYANGKNLGEAEEKLRLV